MKLILSAVIGLCLLSTPAMAFESKADEFIATVELCELSAFKCENIEGVLVFGFQGQGELKEYVAELDNSEDIELAINFWSTILSSYEALTGKKWEDVLARFER